MKDIVYSEMFLSPQGEGHRTGNLSAWIRFWLCNLQCDGFGQKDPTDPSTYVLPYQEFDPSTIKRVEDLPVFQYGCDSSYTWSKKYRSLMHKESVAEVGNKIIDMIPNKSWTNPNPLTNNTVDFCVTGGEPMLHQQSIVDLLEYFKEIDNRPEHMTIETNATKPLTSEFKQWLNSHDNYLESILASMSPKLWAVSGEDPKKAIVIDNIVDYINTFEYHQLKFVANEDPRCWEQIDDILKQLDNRTDLKWQPYVVIMPVGATAESYDQAEIGRIANIAIQRGFDVSGRLHIQLFGNAIGT